MSLPKLKPISPVRFSLLLGALLAIALVVYREEVYRSIRPPELLISELMAVNNATLADADGDFPDWIEIYNPGKQALNLRGWHLSDDFRSLRKWQFPDARIEPGGFLVIFASGKNKTNNTGELHANFSLSESGEYLALVKPNGKTIVDEYLPKYPPLEADVSFGLRAGQFVKGARSNGNGAYRRHAFFATPTPGRANAAEMAGRVMDTKFSHNRGFHYEPFEVAITTKTPGAEIYYTTNGSAPSPSAGTLYQGPIRVERTTVLRARAFKLNFRPTDVDTHTYIFPERVSLQTGEGFPTAWGIRNDAPVRADYEIDPEIRDHPAYRDRLRRSWTALPAVAIGMGPDDLFDGAIGIYSNPLETGSQWERSASVEWIDPTAPAAVQFHCGIRIQGGWNRRPEESPKHSFRLEFRNRHGLPRLDFPLFGEEGVTRFESLILRAGCNNSWLHWSAKERRQGDLVRDQFMRDSLAALGRWSSRGTFVHLYLNGLYWGIYNLCERPDARFLAARGGGAPADYESRNASNVLEGTEEEWHRLFELANAGLADPARYAASSELLDIEQFCDFMLVQIYGGSSDWDAASNWYAGRRARPPGKYQFFVWDGERTLEAVEANILAFDDDRSPTRLFQALRQNAEFCAVFRRQARRHLGQGGALSASVARGRYAALAERLSAAIVAESARWGDYRRDVHPYREGPYELYTVNDHWQPEIERLLTDYFPRRTAEVIRQLEAAGLF